MTHDKTVWAAAELLVLQWKPDNLPARDVVDKTTRLADLIQEYMQEEFPQ